MSDPQFDKQKSLSMNLIARNKEGFIIFAIDKGEIITVTALSGNARRGHLMNLLNCFSKASQVVWRLFLERDDDDKQRYAG